jgi:hypothetical protein
MDMEKTLEGNSHRIIRINSKSFSKRLGWGILGGLAGTLVMDLTLMTVLGSFGSPALTCFSMVGETLARFISMQNVGMAGTILLGVATHYTVGPTIGGIFGLLTARVKILRVYTWKKSLILGILYVEILSQPLLATTPILLKMSVPATLQWYGGSFIMHMIAGSVLGAVVGYGLRSTALPQGRA